MRPRSLSLSCAVMLLVTSAVASARADVIDVEGQPLAAHARRVMQALEFLGHPLPEQTVATVEQAARDRDAAALQRVLDPHVLLQVDINPEYRVKVARVSTDGDHPPAVLAQHGYTPLLVKVVNQGTITQRLRIHSPQAGPVYAGVASNSLQRQQQTELGENEPDDDDSGRFLDVAMFTAPPMTPHLSGLEVEYVIALIYSSESGKREATIGFDVGQGTQDIGFRGEVPVLFDVQPAVPVTLSIRDDDGTPTMARLEFRDSQGRVHPSQAKRLAPDFFFQPQIYRSDGEIISLAPGRYTLTSSRGPEYVVRTQEIDIPRQEPAEVKIRLKRWVRPMEHGYFCGDHHIHGAGCSHYQVPTQGVTPADMFRQVKGEGLNVGCVLTWGPCFDHQRRFFAPVADDVSEPLTLLKYDLEISGFGSAALGHVCLLNLSDQTYPGTDGTTEGWPTWTVPVLRWAKEQGGVVGYPHSDMRVDIPAYVERLLTRHDRNGDGRLDREEALDALLPEPFERIDADRDGFLTREELALAAERASHTLPNLVLPSMRGPGAMEIFVSTAEGVCDFISAMDTGRIGEWNTWYHIMNAGFPLKLSGETDFPCMSSRSVGQGRVYVKLSDGPLETIDFGQWCAGLAAGRSYVSDGYAHALEFSVNGITPGTEDVTLEEPGEVRVTATVAFAPQVPQAVAYGTEEPPEGRRVVGDTRSLYGERSDEWIVGGERLVEIVRNGEVVASVTVPADGNEHRLEFDVPVERSSWIALRHFPQLHTNPVAVLVAGQPIRASRESALWCAEAIELLWENRSRLIAEEERPAAQAAYERAKEQYRQRAREAARKRF
jgi:hypothetical protein